MLTVRLVFLFGFTLCLPVLDDLIDLVEGLKYVQIEQTDELDPDSPEYSILRLYGPKCDIELKDVANFKGKALE